MKNILTIRWTEEAAQNLENITLYLEANWTQEELKRFFTKFEKQLDLITSFPYAYPVSTKRKKVHRCVFTKQVTIYYIVENDQVVLLSLFMTRQNPSKAII